jgi:hypothetical protein
MDSSTVLEGSIGELLVLPPAVRDSHTGKVTRIPVRQIEFIAARQPKPNPWKPDRHQYAWKSLP